jgi:membrane-associated phospholipid phosphatase
MPSMHCAYPLIGLLTAWRVAPFSTRALHVFYTLLMFAASVYLDHHWVLDGIAGWATGIVSVYLAGLVLRQSHPATTPALLESEIAVERIPVAASSGSGASG